MAGTRDPGGGIVEKEKPTTAELTIMISGAVMLVGSFISFYSGGSSSAWSTGLLPVATLLPLYGVIMAGEIALTKFAGAKLPERIGTFTWEQIHLALAIFAAVLALGFLITKNPGLGGGVFIELIAAGGLVYGAIVLQKERNTGAIG
jgi:hypothetical protein